MILHNEEALRTRLEAAGWTQKNDYSAYNADDAIELWVRGSDFILIRVTDNTVSRVFTPFHSRREEMKFLVGTPTGA